jgi:hypothetical protein
LGRPDTNNLGARESTVSLRYIQSQSLKSLDSLMMEYYTAENRDQKPQSLTAFDIFKSRAQKPGLMMEKYLAKTQDQQLRSRTVYSSSLDIEPQFKGLASPMMKSYAAETREPKKGSVMESIMAKARAQQPRSMMQRYLTETQDHQPWKIPKNFRRRLSQITRPQDGQPNHETTTITDNSMSASTDIALLQNNYDVHQDRYEEQHKHSTKDRLSVEQNDKWSLQTESTDASFERLNSRDEDGDSLVGSPSSSSLVSHAGEWSTLDQHFAGLTPPPELPDAGADVSPNANFTTEPQIVDVVPLQQDMAVLFAILSRHAYPRNTSWMINYSPAPPDVAPTNHASANEKALGSSKKRPTDSNQKPKSRDNNKEVDGESDSDDHRRIRQKKTHGPLEEVERREFACPFYKLYPSRYWRICEKIHYPPTSIGLYSMQVGT